MTTETLVLLIILILLAGVLPSWPYSKSWGYRPTGALSILLVIFILWVIVDQRPLFKNSGQSISSSMEETGQDLKSAGRDVADSIRDTVE